MSTTKRAKSKGTGADAAKRDHTSRQAEDRLHAVIALTSDFYWEQDDNLRFTVYQHRHVGSPAGDVFGNILGKTSWELSRTPPEGDENWEKHNALVDARQPFRNVVQKLLDPAAGVRYVSFSGQPIFDAKRRFQGYRGVAQDVTVQTQSDRVLKLEYAVARALAAADTLTDPLPSLIRAICDSEGFEAGNFWTVDTGTGRLRHDASWLAGRDSFVASTLESGAHLPDWLSQGAPVWIADVSRDPRAHGSNIAEATGWNAGLLVPARSGETTVGVLELYAGRICGPEPPVLRVLSATSAQLADYVQRRSAREHLRESEERFSSTMELAAIGIAHVDTRGRFIYANPQLCAMLGYAQQELLGLTVKQISHPSDVEATDELRARLRAGMIKSFKIEKRYLRKNGSAVWVGLTVAAKHDRFGQELYDVSIVEDISVRKTAEERVQYLATHDGLTGLPNRVMFVELLNVAIETARRHDGKLAVLFIDLDRFKIINDTLGHDAGDLLLREMASRLRECLRASDVVARLGGDEFVVLVQEIADANEVSQIARSILSAAMKPVALMGTECRVTASVGVCVFPDAAVDQQSVMKNADMAMYVAKEEGKNNYQVYASSMKATSVERLALETGLRRALERHELFIHYQAKVDFKTGMITGVEALLRWENEELGSVSPAKFIPVAEEMGLIVPIGLWVLQTACAQSVAWQREGLPAVCMSVNLSIRQLHDDHVVEEIGAILEQTGLDPGLLELEITESMIMHDSEKAVRLLTRIKELGVRLAIDDFGTGYSSLAQLKRFPIDTLKVDRSFIREVPGNPEDRAITEAIIAMGKTLSLTIVAEGVETPEQQAFLSERSCDEMQGYYFSVPIAPNDFAALLRKHSPVPRR